MSIPLVVPKVGESITEVIVGDWLKGEGEAASKDEPVVVIETDKATVEISAPESGAVSKMLKKKGEKAQVGETIGYLEAGAAGAKKEAPAAKQKAEAPAAPAAKPAEAPAAPAGNGRRLPPSKRRAAPVEETTRNPERATPEPAPPKPRSGEGESLLRQASSAEAPTGAKARSPEGAEAREETLTPLTPLRKRIAERLVQAQHNAALLTTFNEIDMTAVMALRKHHQEAFTARYGVKLGFMSFFVKAAIDALRHIPQLNSEIRGDSVLSRNYHDIGIAVGGGKGLVVPVLRDADRMSFADIELAIADFGKRAQENKLALDELQGGTFTISNGGVYGSLLSTPIVNPPQSGVLGLHAIQERPVGRDGQIVLRPMMYVALTYDHRIVDGREAVTFLKRVKESVEDPARMLIEI